MPMSSASPTPSRDVQRLRHNVTTACETCRLRRCKCDGSRPVCDVCDQSARHCRYASVTDKRKNRMRSDHVIALQDRIMELERSLEDARSSSTTNSLAPPSFVAPPDRHAMTNGVSGGVLTLEPSGALRFVGPTSTYFRTRPGDLKTGHPKSPLPSSNYLPIPIDFHLHSMIVNRAFQHLNWAEIVVENEFRQGLARASPFRDNHFSPFLHLVVLAIGCRYLTLEEASSMYPTADAFEARGDVLAQAAAAMIEAECSDPNLGTIRGFLGLTGYKSGRGEDRLAVMYLGLALSLAQDFRLHLQYSPTLDDARPNGWDIIDADRKHCLWTCSMVDVLWCSYVGRESGLPRTYLSQSLPPLPDPHMCSLTRLIHSYHARLSHISSRAVEAIYVSGGTSATRFQQMQRYSAACDEWYANLPESLQVKGDPLVAPAPQIITLNAYYHALVVVIHRPFLGPIFDGQINAQVTAKCIDAAYSVVRLIRVQSDSKGVCQGALINQHCAFIAGLILVMVACGMTGTPALSCVESAEAMAALDELTTFLREFAVVWQNARQSADALVNLMSEIIMPDLESAVGLEESDSLG
ncbi:fungal-specific transcription factor domain-domain-containing protein [Naematelia encephala]|uniref:Fungal-specific transcription factor domain-domain-containing protein n=1 Tax=Naematelia encephala TaxID=71784 RepID=A0A1Y2AR91_9TREE|nr:fungal-specific transcription factor domain-domain-containing protein [Naematelia encephala]